MLSSQVFKFWRNLLNCCFVCFDWICHHVRGKEECCPFTWSRETKPEVRCQHHDGEAAQSLEGIHKYCNKADRQSFWINQENNVYLFLKRQLFCCFSVDYWSFIVVYYWTSIKISFEAYCSFLKNNKNLLKNRVWIFSLTYMAIKRFSTALCAHEWALSDFSPQIAWKRMRKHSKLCEILLWPLSPSFVVVCMRAVSVVPHSYKPGFFQVDKLER